MSGMEDMEAMDQSTSVEMFWGINILILCKEKNVLPFAFLWFSGTKLSSKSKVYEYNGESDEEEGIDTVVELRGVFYLQFNKNYLNYQFFFSQACLGAEAKNERNIVNLTAEMDGENVTHSILSMRLEKNEQVITIAVSFIRVCLFLFCLIRMHSVHYACYFLFRSLHVPMYSTRMCEPIFSFYTFWNTLMHMS